MNETTQTTRASSQILNLKQENLFIQTLVRGLQSVNMRVKRGADMTVVMEKHSIIVYGRRFDLLVEYNDGYLKILWETEYKSLDIGKTIRKSKKAKVKISVDRAEQVIDKLVTVIVSMTHIDLYDEEIYDFVKKEVAPLIPQVDE
jgi:hypothetical protein